ncbi:hypothetical protein ACJMK2_009919 [Sinanodonta woodiana]|uniref:Tumor protein p53-inducible nuclear protein 1 n=1 Tax=Sinanodonta woodiana TaxID=1069815 RepID=A0ABD3VDQ8_SINWO
MLSGLSSLFFGSSTSSNTDVNEDAKQTTELVSESTSPAPANLELDLRTSPAADCSDWILVDVSGGSGASCVTNCHDHAYSCNHCVDHSDSDSVCVSLSLPSTPDSLSPVPQFKHMLKHAKCNSKEKWILTPPPCFTAGNRENSHVEIGPMENLLIEHPSMSVYQTGSMLDSESEESESSTSSTGTTPMMPSHQTQVANHHAQLAHRQNAVNARDAVLAQISVNKSAQAVQRYHNTRSFSRKHFNRINKIHDVQSFGKPVGRRNRLRCPSGQMCGRISQRRQ